MVKQIELFLNFIKKFLHNFAKNDWFFGFDGVYYRQMRLWKSNDHR